MTAPKVRKIDENEYAKHGLGEHGFAQLECHYRVKLEFQKPSTQILTKQ